MDSVESKDSYFMRLFDSKEGDQNHFFSVQYKYTLQSYGSTFNTQGGMASFGINLARFFSTKFILGVTSDLKLLPGIRNVNPSDEFSSDFQGSYTPISGPPQDSANAEVFYSNIVYGGIRGHNMFNIGLMFSPFPQKYGGFMLEIKRGNTGHQFHNSIYQNLFVNGGGNDKVPMSVGGNLRFELTCKPLAFFRNAYYDHYSYSGFEIFLNSLVIGFYYERFNFQTAQFGGTNLRDAVDNEFISKYGIDHRFGFKIGFAFY